MEKTQEKTAENQAVQPKKRLAKVVNLTGHAKETYESFRSSHPELASLTDSQTVETLIAAYGDSESVSSRMIELESFLAEKESLIKEAAEKIDALAAEKEDLRKQLADAEKTANANGEAASALQMKIDGMQLKENQIVCDVHPVAMHFLREMAKKTKTSESYILVDLFIRDLQNPRSNNLPYIVTSDEIRQVIDELKAKKEGE